ncbi:MAG: DNRLRE domain-containing protein, partial [Ignavibacteriae bacterium]|nr:DNRLRE domain-containing protein [Ignavibacteriota bacterium]
IPHRDTVNVLSAKITLRSVSWFGDSTGSFGFSVHKILEGWNQSTLSWDSIQARPGFYELTERGSYSGFVEGDTSKFTFDIDTALARQWLLPLTVASYGIVLIPTQSTNVVRGIHAFDVDSSSFYPTLEIIASNVAGTTRDTSTYVFGFDTFVGNIDNLNANPQLLYAQAGVVYRSKIQFDVSFIPRGAIINSATLYLEKDPATSRISKFTVDSVVTVHVFRSGTDSTVFESQNSEGQRVGGTPNTFSFEARHAVQYWLAGTNDGLLLRQTDVTEYNTFDLFTFHSHLATNTSLRPRLAVKYTLEKN